MSEADRAGLVTPLIAAGLFFSGVTYASTLSYAAIVGIETLGIPHDTYAILLGAASLVGAAASVTLGQLSDRIGDRRVLVIGCALAGALGFSLIYLLRSPVAFMVAIAAIMPFGGALFSQSFSFARSYYDARRPTRAEFMVSVLRTMFALAWAIVPPVAGWVATTAGVFEVYGIGAAAYLACAAIYAVLLGIPAARIGTHRAAGGSGPKPTPARVEPAVAAGIAGCTLIFIAMQINNITVPLAITVSLRGSYADLGLFAGLAAALELPFMVLWGLALRWISKHAIISIAGLLYALYFVLLNRAGSVADVLWLQVINGPATAAVVSIPISYLQDAIRGRVGLSTSLIDVVMVVAALSAAAVFGVLTTASPDYPLLFLVAAALSALGALVLFSAHRLLRPRTPAR